MANAVTKVVNNCKEAKETNTLNLSNCTLKQVPDAVYHLLRNVEIKTCDFSENVLSKITPKFVLNFSSLMTLNLSYNQLSSLPEECIDFKFLETLNISHNSFISLPNCVHKIPKLIQLDASNNHIVDVDIKALKEASSLEAVDLTKNSISHKNYEELRELTNVKVLLTPRQKEDWEDLTI
ncbi:unnamed protein product [Brassicogethes aeneus]|uniref:Disease resistance R13L4/SHOC-2-like LRR domain-containing protein n=1 Tax=Brassicogethes aeneus TaxID=1431903 RepID=A0A9P0B175_BRAAE|nr:unnamed protein product [Brassicogethes aeneus]